LPGPTTSSSSSSVPLKKKHLQNITNISRSHNNKFSPKKNQASLFQYRVKSPSNSVVQDSTTPASVLLTVPLTVPVPVPIQVPAPIPNPEPTPSQETLEPFLPIFPTIVIPTTQKKKETKISNDQE